MDRKGGAMKRNRNLQRAFTPLLFLSFLLISGANFAFSQKDFFMEEKNLYEKYKLSVKSFEKGKSYFQKGDYKKAEKELKTCLEIFPLHSQAHFYLSNVFYKKGETKEALSHIEEAKASYQYMVKMYALGHEDYTSKLRVQRDECKSKIMDYKDKLSKTADREEMQMWSNAISSLESEVGTINNRLADPLPSNKEVPADYFYLHGNIFFRLKKYQEAHDQYIECIRIDPEHGNSYNNLANLYFMANQYQKALEYLEQAEARGVEINSEFKKAVLKALGK